MLSGTGIHTGAECRSLLLPAQVGAGLVFRVDGVAIPAKVEYVVDTARSTSLGRNGKLVHSVEHILAAFSGLKVDNAEVLVEGPEIPAFDGSALPICEAIRAAGIVEQAARIEVLGIERPIRVESEDGYIVASPAKEFRASYRMEYDHPMIGSQFSEYETGGDSFCQRIAPARTFVLYEEVEELRERGLAQGGSLENVVVVWPDRVSCEPRMPDELSVHKLLDLIGDLALVGRPLLAEVQAVRSGHALNVRLAQAIVSEAENGEHSDA